MTNDDTPIREPEQIRQAVSACHPGRQNGVGCQGDLDLGLIAQMATDTGLTRYYGESSKVS
jgi:hypothetical protein